MKKPKRTRPPSRTAWELNERQRLREENRQKEAMEQQEQQARDETHRGSMSPRRLLLTAAIFGIRMLNEHEGNRP